MNCPDWSRLAAERKRDLSEPEGWAEALAHFDSCGLCHKEALAADPLLVFRRLPAVELTPAEESLEVESMQQAVAAMRTARRLEARGRFAGWRRWAAAAVLAAVSLGVGRDKSPRLQEVAAVPPAYAPAVQKPAVPTIEDLDRPGARVYQMGDEGFSISMIIDESLDV
ncbi:MAG TPA: hypothetical protein VHC97_21735 [Thermoanaerobaculia bacterium]|nr:hypothetical protein [Thermoanaerobaculia bacterium]